MTDINDLYVELIASYDTFNARLFGNVLPDCALTLTRHSKAYGFFAPDSFRSRGGDTAPEIALNPEYLINRDAIDIYSTLVHEMCHYYQMKFGNPSRSGYHNKEFAAIMKSVGLIASSNSQPGGKSTGQNMSHYVEPGGLFEQVYLEMNATRIAQWGAVPMEKESAKPVSKLKYTCPECGQNAWAKPNSCLACGCRQDDGFGWAEMVTVQLI